MERATERLVAAERARVVAEQADAWGRAQRLREYLGAMRDRIDDMADQGQSSRALEWLHWCVRHVDEQVDPLGGTIAVLRWEPGRAVLQRPGQAPQPWPSMEAMLEQVAGSALPPTALFDWLEGTATPVAGWEPDLSLLGEGRLRARRLEPPPLADLRIVLDH